MLHVRHIVADHLPIDNGRRVLTVMEMLHILVDVVFLAYLGAQGDPHLVMPVVAHPAVGVFIRREHLMHCSIFLTTDRRKKDRLVISYLSTLQSNRMQSTYG